MPSLREEQARFASLLLSDRDPGERIAVYRNTVFSNYRNALGATYPVVRSLVGTPFFNAAVDAYVIAYPSTRGDLNLYGDRFGEFLASYPHAQELPYLPDVARLEWAIDEAGRGADATGTAEQMMAALGAFPAAAVASQHLALDPSCRLLESRFPIFRIWQVHQPGANGEPRVEFGVAPDRLLVRRERSAVTIERIGAADFAWLCSLRDGADLAASLDTAIAVDADFDLDTALRACISNRTIASLEVSQ